MSADATPNGPPAATDQQLNNNNNDRLRKILYYIPMFRSAITTEAICLVDNIPLSAENNNIIIFRFLASERFRSLNYGEREVYYCKLPTLITPEELRNELSDCVEEIFPFVCKCFCNLLDPLARSTPHYRFYEQDAEELFRGPILDSMDTKWHFHFMMLFKEGNPYKRQTQRRIRKLIIAQKQQQRNNDDSVETHYQFRRIKDYSHLVNTALLICGRQSILEVNTHTFHSLGFYIDENQKTALREKLRVPSSNDVTCVNKNCHVCSPFNENPRRQHVPTTTTNVSSSSSSNSSSSNSNFSYSSSNFSSNSTKIKKIRLAHLGMLPRVLCLFCGENFKTSGSLKSHMHKKHRDIVVEPPPPPTTAQTNDFSLFSASQIQKIKQKSVIARTIGINNNNRYLCTLCSCVYDSAEAFTEHLEKKHPKRVSCKDCGQTLPDNYILHYHQEENQCHEYCTDILFFQ